MKGVIFMMRYFTINNLGCAHCGAKIEEAISKLEGIESAVLNFPLKKLSISGEFNDDTLSSMNSVARSIEPDVEILPLDHTHKHHHHDEHCEHGHEHNHHDEHCEFSHEHHHHDEHCECGHEHTHEHSHGHSHEHSHDHGEKISNELIPVICGAALFAAAVICSRLLDIFPLTAALYAAAYLTLGYNVLLSAFKGIRAGNFFDENTLMTVATLGAFAIGECAEAVGVVLFFRIGEFFEDIAVSRSRKAITDVAALKVEEADILTNGEFIRRDTDDIRAGDIIRVKTGERIAADGVIESGESRIDTSAVNGEPVPLTVRTGDSVMSGCINLADTITVRASFPADESTIAKIARAVETASAEKPQIDRFVTRFAKIYTPIVILAALFTAVIPSVITGEWSKWIHSALTFLVISCPCALVLSVPLAYFSAVGAASKLGILFKGGASVEALGKVRAIAFDKTGTLTDGSFTVTDVRSFGKLSAEQLLTICGSCEQTSSHPIAQSIAERCRIDGIVLASPERSGEIAGRGLSAELNGNTVLCGNARLMNENDITIPEISNIPGCAVYIAVNGSAEGMIIVSDTVKSSAESAVKGLDRLGMATAMFTGDKPENAQIVGSSLGIEHIRGGLLPEDKLSELTSLREKYGSVMFVGDGINDAPVLAGADVGGAMQSGSDIAIEAADAVFMNSEPESVLRAKRIADKALRISYQNIIFALGIKAAVLILGLLGHPNMWLAVFADSGTAMLLILNSVRILNTKKYL